MRINLNCMKAEMFLKYFRNPCQVCIHSGQNKAFKVSHDLQKICAEEIIVHKSYSESKWLICNLKTLRHVPFSCIDVQ